jgi:hypothetical protein
VDEYLPVPARGARRLASLISIDTRPVEIRFEQRPVSWLCVAPGVQSRSGSPGAVHDTVCDDLDRAILRIIALCHGVTHRLI